MIKLHIKRVVFFLQKMILMLSYLYYGKRGCKRKVGSYVIGVEEIASMLSNISGALDNMTSVTLYENRFYSFKYDYDLSRFKLIKYLLSPWVLGRLMRANAGFIYIGKNGFLIDDFDGREFEFKYIKSKKLEIICFFTGSDIRSVDLLNEYGRKNDIDVITNYQKYTHHLIGCPSKERHRKLLASVADGYADYIFNPSVDQMSYMKSKTHPFLYFIKDDEIGFNNNKWEEVERLKVVHAPSSPIIKGTQLVRAAVKKLKEDGYDFEYVEIIDMPHQEVINNLKNAHIALNEFYAFVPGVFGVEAMASNALLLTSATSSIEPTLFEGADDAWVVTPYWRIYDKLKEQLDSPISVLKEQADNGTRWVDNYCSYSFSASYLKKLIYRSYD